MFGTGFNTFASKGDKEIAGVSLVKPRELEYYIQNARQLKKFRDENCLFKNYRAMDMKLYIYGRSKESIEDKSDSLKRQEVACLNLLMMNMRLLWI